MKHRLMLTMREHRALVTRGAKGSCERPGLARFYTLLGNFKYAIDGTYQACEQRYAGRYLSEFPYRFSRRNELADLVPRLVYLAGRTSPLPDRLPTVSGTAG